MPRVSVSTAFSLALSIVGRSSSTVALIPASIRPNGWGKRRRTSALEVVKSHVVVVRVVKQRLRGYAADVQARASQLAALFNACRLNRSNK
jgi:hypothetical protein